MGANEQILVDLRSGTTAPGFFPWALRIRPSYVVAADDERLWIASREGRELTQLLFIDHNSIESVTTEKRGPAEWSRAWYIDIDTADGQRLEVKAPSRPHRQLLADLRDVAKSVSPTPPKESVTQEFTMWQGTRHDVRSMARFLGGPDMAAAGAMDHLRWAVQITEAGVFIGQGLVRGVIGLLTTLPTGGAVEIRKVEWDHVDFVWIADEGVSRVNKSALVAFGILAVGAKKHATSLALSIDGETFFLESSRPFAEWRAELAPMIQQHRHLGAKIHLNTSFPAAKEQPSLGGEIGDALRKLERLRTEGLLQEAEYQAKRKEILGRL